jgi:hypothetical protein
MHEIGMAVVVDFDDGTSLIISWAMQGLAGGLDFEAGSTREVATLPKQESEFDVSQDAHWREILGNSIASVAVAWDISGPATDEPPSYLEVLWAIQVVFSGGEGVVIAIGAVEEDAIKYDPQSLVVFFDEKDAGAYRSSRGQVATDGELIAGHVL